VCLDPFAGCGLPRSRAILFTVSTTFSTSTAWDAGCKRWPGVVVDRTGFEAFLATLPSDAVEKYADDLFLARGCSEGDPAAIRWFEKDLLIPAQSAMRSIDSSDSFIDEASQRLRTHLLVGVGPSPPRIASYAARGPLRSWVGVSAARVALMMQRSSRRSNEVSEDNWTSIICAAPSGTPELELLKHQHAAAFAAALSEAAHALEPRLRSVLRMHFVDDLSIDQIGAAYAVHRATAARWIQRARELLFTSTRTRLADLLSVSGPELDRITALVQSQLDVSLSQLLPPDLENR
jgi:RNA polymerase sigma-70 factor, ECF subfamily